MVSADVERAAEPVDGVIDHEEAADEAPVNGHADTSTAKRVSSPKRARSAEAGEDDVDGVASGVNGKHPGLPLSRGFSTDMRKTGEAKRPRLEETAAK